VRAIFIGHVYCLCHVVVLIAYDSRAISVNFCRPFVLIGLLVCKQNVRPLDT